MMRQGVESQFKRDTAMIKKALVAVILFACVLTADVAGDNLRSFEIWGSFSFGRLQSGYQKDAIDGILLARGNSALIPILGLRGFFVGPLGLEASLGIFGRTRADYIAHDSLDAFDYTLVNLGPVLRLSFPGVYRSMFALVLGAGANYSMIGAHEETWTTSQDIVSDIGYYGKASLAWYLAPFVFFDFTFWYYYMNSHFTGGQKLDGTYYLAAFSVGVGI